MGTGQAGTDRDGDGSVRDGSIGDKSVGNGSVAKKLQRTLLLFTGFCTFLGPFEGAQMAKNSI